MDLLIKGGTVVTATSSFKADVAVKNGKISAIGANLKPEKKTEVVDAKGKMILPGAIDGHTHLAMPFGGTVATDDYFTGTRAAACGGTEFHQPMIKFYNPRHSWYHNRRNYGRCSGKKRCDL